MSEFDKVIGYRSIKKELEQISDTLKHMEVYRDLGVSAPHGLLLHGEPGVGKTLMASALIAESGRPVFVCRKDKPNGQFVDEIRNTFERAAAAAPSIVFLDDMDKFANADDRHTDAEEYVTVQSCIDENKGKDIFVLATANSLRCLPRSLKRCGRFDRVIEVDTPSGKDAERIIAHYLEGKKFVSGIDLPTITRILHGHSCAQLETVINEAGLLAGYERSAEITMDHLVTACLRVIYDMPEPDDDDYDDFDEGTPSEHPSDPGTTDRAVLLHEAGHAVVSEVLVPGSVTLVTSRLNSGNEMAFTAYYHPENCSRYLWKVSRIMTALGGMAATEIMLGIPDMGNGRDLSMAVHETRNLIMDNGLGGLGLVEDDFRNSNDRSVRQENAAENLLNQYYAQVKRILLDNRELFDRIARELEEKKLLTCSDISRIRESTKVVPLKLF